MTQLHLAGQRESRNSGGGFLLLPWCTFACPQAARLLIALHNGPDLCTLDLSAMVVECQPHAAHCTNACSRALTGPVDGRVYSTQQTSLVCGQP
jgi:hypothetical protein